MRCRDASGHVASAPDREHKSACEHKEHSPRAEAALRYRAQNQLKLISQERYKLPEIFA